MEKYEIQKLRDLPIEGVAKQLGMVVKRHKALCPFHADHHASLSFNTRKNNCRCFVCMGDSVGTIDLVMKHLGKDFLSACRWLAEVNGVYLEEGRKREASSSYSSLGGSSSGGSFSGDNTGGSSSGENPGALLRERIRGALLRERIRGALLRERIRGALLRENPPPSMPAGMRDSLSIRG